MQQSNGMKCVLFYGFFVVLMVLMLWEYLLGDKILMTTDAAIRGADWTWQDVLCRLGPYWHDGRLLGSPRGSGGQLANIYKGFTSGVLWNNTAYVLACLLASFAFLRYFRRMNPWIACLGAVAAFWMGTNFTLMLAGHFYKPYIVMFFAFSLLPAAHAAKGSVAHGLIWGSCVGLMFVQQPDVALFFALFAGMYMLVLLWKEQGFRLAQWLKVLVPASAVALLFALGPLLYGYQYQVKGAAQMQSSDSKAKWDYVTQWSVPPDEMMDIVAPGYYGWRSGEPEGPYWGRTGRSAGWEQTHQGFQNFRIESVYIGMIPLAFAIFALFACRRSKYKVEILFWAGATVVALLLSFGKYFPLYALFYKLPVVNNIRNPNKFIQVFQVCLAILAVYGFDALWRSRHNNGHDEQMARPVRTFFWTSVGLLAVLGLWALVATLGCESTAGNLVSAGWPKEAAATIAQNKASAMWHAAFMAAATALVFGIFSFRKLESIARYRNTIAAILVLIVAVDAIKLSKHYIKEMPLSYIEANPLTDFLKANLGDQRVALLSQDGINNIWITYLFPYNGISCFNFTDMPRMANDYKAFLEAGQRNPLNMWRLSAVKYLLGPSSMEKQLAAAGCRKVFTYGLSDAGHGEFKLAAYPNGPFAVYELQGSLPRYALFAGSQKVSDEQLLSASLANLNKVYLPETSSLPDLSGIGQVGIVKVLSYRAGKVRLKVEAKAPAILRAADKYDPDWKASIDGKGAPMERVDYLCQGVSIPAGEHEVVLRYAPGRLYFYLQCLGMLTLLGALVFVMMKRQGEDVAD